MKFNRGFIGIALLAFAPIALPQSSNPLKPDNTKQNQAGGPGDKPTADQQKQNRPDINLAQQIRKSIADDKSLSTYAHNAKIIVQDGQVTLKGPVRSNAEKRSIEAKAKTIAGDDHVRSELTIVEKSSN